MKRSTLVALAVLVLLIGVVYWLDREDDAASDVDRVFDVTESEIARVEIRRAGSAPTVVERDGERFRIVAPVAANADAREVELVVSNLATMSAVRSFARDDATDVAEYGLDAPKLEVLFVTDEGATGAIRFGKDTLTPSNQYAERDGADDVLVMPTHFAQNLDKSAWDLRDKAIFRLPDDAEPVRVTIVHGDDVTEIAMDADGVWMTSRPPRARVDRFDVTGMVARFRRAEMLALAEDDALTGVDSPAHRLTVEFRGDVEPMSIAVGNKRNVDYFARVPSRETTFLIEGSLVGELRSSTDEWWSAKLLHVPTTAATVVTIGTSDGVRSLDRDDAQPLLRALSDATAEDVTAPARVGDPSYMITVATDDEADEIAFYVTEGGVYATRKDEDVSLTMASDAWTAIEAQLTTED